MKNKLLLFLLKISLVLLPLVFLLVIYFLYDPFKVLKSYDSYYVSGAEYYMPLNRDVVSTEVFLGNNPTTIYTSFIMGNSGSLAYLTRNWKKYIGAENCLHFDASAESLYGIVKKLQLVERSKGMIKNVLIVATPDVFKVTTNSEGMAFIKHNALSDQNQVLFQFEFLKAFLNNDFFPSFLHYKIVGKKTTFNKGIFDTRPIRYVPLTNEIEAFKADSELSVNPDRYYSDHQDYFPARSSAITYAPRGIGEEQSVMLKELQSVFIRNRTRYAIVLSPRYTRTNIDSLDLYKLQSIFGKEHVFNFSVDTSIVNNQINFYDGDGHYRPHVTCYIMDSVYGSLEKQPLKN